MKRKEEKKKAKGSRFRSARDTIEERTTKKLTEATSWYKEKEKENEEDEKNTYERVREKENDWNRYGKVNKKRKRITEIEVEGKKKVMSVVFVPHTRKSELAKRLREKLESLEKLGNLKIKIVEETGEKLVDLLHRSDAWSNTDCNREDCLICCSAGEEEKKGKCKRRNVVYETYCITCREKEEKERKDKELKENTEEKELPEKIVTLDEMIEMEKENIRKRKRYEESKLEAEKENKKEKTEAEKEKKDYTFKYIGETGRSGYERGQEHVKSFENFDETSHLLKHYLLLHKDIKMSEMKYGMRIRNTYRSALERQVGEAVAIDVEQRRGQKLMNSKSEYNRCHIQRINTKSQKEIMKEREEETAEEIRVKEEIKQIRRKKRDMKIEKEMNQPNLKRVCLEIQNENLMKWKERKKKELERKKEEEKIDDEK